MNKIFTLVTIVSAMTLVACNRPAEEDVAEEAAARSKVPVTVDCPAADESGNIEIAPGLSAKIIKTGYGRAAVKGDFADTNVWLWQLDESADDRHGQFVWESGANVFQFRLGAGQVIRGWDLGVPCMLEGETRELIVASDLAYGAAGRGSAIPPNTPLIFTIELLELTSSE
jgi:FKBP-type peptidyl-prolyl cis-trans isomerase FkpA